MQNPSNPLAPILITISPGEWCDRYTILTIKVDRLRHSDEPDQTKLYAAVKQRAELFETSPAFASRLHADPVLWQLFKLLEDINYQLWTVEDDLRRCEAKESFGSFFVDMARRVYKLNDTRSLLKNEITRRLGGEIEIKQLPDYPDLVAARVSLADPTWETGVVSPLDPRYISPLSDFPSLPIKTEVPE